MWCKTVGLGSLCLKPSNLYSTWIAPGQRPDLSSEGRGLVPHFSPS